MNDSLHAIVMALYRRMSAALKGERLLTHNIVVGLGTVAAGLLGVAFQSVISHGYRPVDYGAVFAVVTLITFIGLPASAFTLLMARQTSHGRASGHLYGSAALLRNGNASLLAGGSVAAGAIAVASPYLAGFLGLPNGLLWAAAAGIPFTLALPLLLGELQGAERFTEYALVSSGQAALKLVAAVVLGLLYGPVGVIAGVSAGTLVAYAAAAIMVRRTLRVRTSQPWLRPALVYLAKVLPSTIALGVLLSADVLLVKHYFPKDQAGEYAAVAALGRAIFWGASGVAVVLFPKVAFRGAQGRSGIQLVIASLLLVAIGGAVGSGFLALASAGLLRAFAGSSYVAGATYLPWYGLGMMLLGGATVLIATHQSRGRAGFLVVLLPLTAVEPILILMFHYTLVQVVQVIDIAMALIVAGLAAWYALEERSSTASRRAFGVIPSASPAPQLQVNR